MICEQLIFELDLFRESVDSVYKTRLNDLLNKLVNDSFLNWTHHLTGVEDD